jgi:protocatechuate 3,4-dioxygenase beta subunit
MNKVLRFVLPVAALALAFAAPDALRAQKKHEPAVRSVSGVVSDVDGAGVNGAVVQLKNTKTLQIRSFITKDQGQYYFQGLSPDVDFELHAEGKDAKSATKTLSSFNSDKQAVINLKLSK